MNSFDDCATGKCTIPDVAALNGSSSVFCANCRRPVRQCACPKGTVGAAKVGPVRVGRETQGRAGKGVTTITGLPLAQEDLDTLAANLKKRCGCGGTVRSGVIEVQGDHRDLIVAELLKLGWPAKRSGG